MRSLPLVLAFAAHSCLALAADSPSEAKSAALDPYGWMEDTSRAGEVRDWIVAASKMTAAELDALPVRAQFKALLEQSTMAGVRYFAPISAGGRLFFRQLDAGAQLQKLVVREAGNDRVLFDPASLGDKPPAINNYSVAPNGQTVAVHVSQGGGEVGEIRFLDVKSGRELPRKLAPVWGQFPVD